MVIFPLAPDQTIAQMWSNGARGCGGSRQVDCKCYISCYHIIPERNDLCCFGFV